MLVISYSLWKGTEKYDFTDGIFENIKLAKKYYPDWICKFFCSEDVPANITEKIISMDALVEIVEPPYKGTWEGLFWRFKPAADPYVSHMISRDIDSRISPREVAAVEEWMDSGKSFHSMRDSIYHTIVPVLGGMWGVTNNALIDIEEWINNWSIFDHKGCDQEFLQSIVWPKVMEDSLVHERFPNGVEERGYKYHPKLWGGDVRPFPPHDSYNSKILGPFVGSRIEEEIT